MNFYLYSGIHDVQLDSILYKTATVDLTGYFTEIPCEQHTLQTQLLHYRGSNKKEHPSA